MTVNFTGGLLKLGNQYINPDHIVTIKGDNRYDGKVGDAYYEELFEKNPNDSEPLFTHFILTKEIKDSKNKTIDTTVLISPKKFVQKMMEAQQTGKVIDLNA